MNNYELTKYKNQWAIFCKTTKCFVLFGPKKRLQLRVIELNMPIVREATAKVNQKYWSKK